MTENLTPEQIEALDGPCRARHEGRRTVSVDLVALREWAPGAKEEPSHGEHVMIRYLRAGALSGDLRPVWRCSCDPVNQYGIYMPDLDKWIGRGSPDDHKRAALDTKEDGQ